ncbi:hypothetical protein GCM10017774_42690 [Lentzea cavernae]|uniref:Uncharacterized protein n=1 Tax=Lentzea cavernae TaxID=2020703 RepID=A0ABQ3MHK2_9PSEU|nr:hypothetical protein GCM10017774_42690 [Lentzea cavernae]
MDCGPTSPTPFAYYGPDTSSWRTSQPSLFEDIPESQPTWPRSGMTCGGYAYALPTSAHPTAATAGSDTPHLPTPTTSDSNGTGRHGNGALDLRTTVALLPTPKASDGTKGGPNQRGSSGDLSPPSAATRLLPTPTRADAERSSATYARGNPTLFGALSGEPSNPPSADGNTCSDDPPPSPPSPEPEATTS